MGSIQVKRFETPDETLPFEGKGRVEVVHLAGREAGRAIFEPGWRWSDNVKPIEPAHIHLMQFGVFVPKGP